ncbi:unnamed protein product, partial [Mesorhabditis belari]|uniref:Uncharacterized protein n=1 Tax=Mesorhabditis belari TaxID=2138241 RepID=A0AAF3FQZ6_9BILA
MERKTSRMSLLSSYSSFPTMRPAIAKFNDFIARDSHKEPVTRKSIRYNSLRSYLAGTVVEELDPDEDDDEIREMSSTIPSPHRGRLALMTSVTTPKGVVKLSRIELANM